MFFMKIIRKTTLLTEKIKITNQYYMKQVMFVMFFYQLLLTEKNIISFIEISPSP